MKTDSLKDVNADIAMRLYLVALMKHEQNLKTNLKEPLQTGRLSFREKMSRYLSLRIKEQHRRQLELNKQLAEGQPKSDNAKGSSN